MFRARSRWPVVLGGITVLGLLVGLRPSVAAPRPGPLPPGGYVGTVTYKDLYDHAAFMIVKQPGKHPQVLVGVEEFGFFHGTATAQPDGSIAVAGIRRFGPKPWQIWTVRMRLTRQAGEDGESLTGTCLLAQYDAVLPARDIHLKLVVPPG